MIFYEEALKLEADGIVFYPIGHNPNKLECKVYCIYTTEQLKSQTLFPRSCYSFYKMIDGKRKYL